MEGLNTFDSKSESMKVSVVIPFRNRIPVVDECIESVKKQDYKNIEIIAVSDRVKLDCGNVISLMNPHCMGVGAKRNLGARKATGEILFFLDSDCIVKKNTISNLLKTFKKYDTDAVSGKPLATKNANLLGLVTGLEYEHRFDEMGENFVDVAATTCLGVKRDVFKRVGGFRDYSKGEAVGEDWDFSARLRNMGFKIFHTNKVEVYHMHTNEPFWKWFNKRIQFSRYRITHYRKYKKGADQYMTWKALLTATLLFNIPTTIAIYNKTKNSKILLLPFYSFMRNIAWAIGVLAGLLFD
jgi:cellulose synthase/poly-beta-1,6-N-acetylglucosamine synthase-like glycosyltransferase